MLHQFLLWSIFGTGLVKGILCPGDDWNLNGSKCYKIIDDDVSYDKGKTICMNETINGTLVIPKTRQEVEFINSMYSNFIIWLGLRFRMGSVWMWNDNTEYNASMEVSWSDVTPNNPPDLCIYTGNAYNGYMMDWECIGISGVVCQRHLEDCPNDPAWKQLGILCYIVLLDTTNGVTYDEAKNRCRNINGTVIMPKTNEDAKLITSSLNFGISCWIGLTDYNADYVYTWEDGTNQLSSSLFWHPGGDHGSWIISKQPNGRDYAYLCAAMFNGEMYDVQCNTDYKVVCQVDAKTELQTTLYDQTTNHVNLEITTLPTETTGKPATFYNQTTNYANLETTLPTETTGTPATFYNQTTNYANFDTTILPATNMSLTLTSLECEKLWMNQCRCNCQEPTAITEIPNDIITYRLDKTTLSSYIRKRSSASDPRKSSFYMGCVGIIVLVLSVLFIVVLDFIPRRNTTLRN